MKLLLVTVAAMAVFSKDFTTGAQDNSNEPVIHGNTAEVQEFCDMAAIRRHGGNSFNESKLVDQLEENPMVRRRRKSLCRRKFNGYCVRRRKPCPDRFPLQTAPNKPLCSKFHRCCYQDEHNCTTADIVSIGSEVYKVYNDKYYSWYEAKQKCTNCGGLVMAEPQDPPAVAGYLQDTYGYNISAYFWLGARGDGSTFVWNSGSVLSNTSPHWMYNYPGTKITTDHCLMTRTRTEPYWAYGCIYGGYPICQCA